MTQKKEITSLEDIRQLVDLFYEKVRNDDLLGNIFNRIIQDHWTKHLEKMYRFWQTVLLSEHSYFGSPFVPHAKLPIRKEHFNRWKQLFFATVDENFYGEKAIEAKHRAERMAEIFQLKIDHIQNSNK